MTSILLLFLSVLLFSLYPLLASIGLQHTNPMLFLLTAHGCCAVFALAYGKFLHMRNTAETSKAAPLFKLNKRTWGTVAATGISSAINHTCFLFALLLTSKVGATMIYETWPIIALWLAPLLVPKGWNNVRLADYFFGFLAVVGGVFVVAAGHRDALLALDFTFFHKIAPEQLQGYGLALIGSIGVAVSTVLRRRVTQALRDQHDDNLLLATYLSTGITRLAALPIFVLFMFVLQGYATTQTGIDINGFLLAAATGIAVHLLGSVFYVISLMKNPDPLIPVPDFLAPILSVLWLVVLGYDGLTDFAVIGGLCIISANLLVTVRAEDGFAYTSSILTLLLGGIYCYLTTTTEMNSFYDAISVSAVFYAILIAFAWDRVLERAKHEESLIIDIAYGIEALKNKASKAAAQDVQQIAEHIQRILHTTDKIVIGNIYRTVCQLRTGMHLPEETRQLFHDLDSLILSRTKDIMLSEIVLLCLIGGVTFFGILSHRPPGLWPDMMAFIMAGAIVFIFFAIFDQLGIRKKSLISTDPDTPCLLHNDFFQSRNEFKLVTIILIAVMLTVFYGLFAYKYAA